MTQNYDPGNVFARMLRGEIPCNTVLEDEHVLAFNDIHPKAPVHILVIPKGAYVSMTDFAQTASPTEQLALMAAIGRIIENKNLAQDGYRVVANAGTHGGQEVPHFHLHILAGEPLGPIARNAG